MALVNWIIVVAYIIAVIGISYFAGRSQKSQEDYYLGGRSMSSWLVASSFLANQVSAISLISAPAFIAVRSRGGLAWLQYELAVPLSMLFIILFLVPAYRKNSGITIYGFLEQRFGRPTRMALSLIFMVNRSVSAGVILLAASYVTCVLLNLDVYATILLLGIVSLAYTSIGGMRADIYTDAIQLIVLWVSYIACIVILVDLLGGTAAFPAGEAGRLTVFNLHSTGIRDGETFSFWPMLFGGFFLYVSYYGCDQSQAQRLLATPSPGESSKALAINGIIRFPLVSTYCSVGVLMIMFMADNPDFAARLDGLSPDYLMPLFFMHHVPDGLLGIMVVGILSASMSSLDSAVNSISAVTWEDFLKKSLPRLASMKGKSQVMLFRLITVIWGCISIGFAMAIAGSSETIIEVVNKIGSALYGPIAGVFALGIFCKRATGRGALAGLAGGMLVNGILWLMFEARVSWMWWNLTGFAVTLGAGAAAGQASGRSGTRKPAVPADVNRENMRRWGPALVLWFVAIIAACAALEYLLARFLPVR
jgi:SSS family solute:Na+ symporter